MMKDQSPAAGAVSTQRVPRCVHCGEVIGTYEPTVTLAGGRVHVASRAADPQLAGLAGERYHRACFTRMRRDGDGR